MKAGEYVGQPSVLVVDDDEMVREFLRTMLSSMGWQVMEAENGQEAVQMADEREWDLVLMDIRMPVLGGMEALVRIRESHAIERLPVVMITGQDDPGVKLECLRKGANDFLGKPVETTELMARIGTILMMRRTEQILRERIDEMEKEKVFEKLMMHYLVEDTRGPLTGARLFIQLALANEAGVQGSAAGYLRKALAMIDRAGAVGAEAVDLSRMDEREVRLKSEPQDLAEILKTRVEMMKEYCLARKARIGMRTAESLPRVRADRRLLERLLDNLLAAAVNRAAGGGEVEVRSEQSADSLAVIMSASSGSREESEFPGEEWKHRPVIISGPKADGIRPSELGLELSKRAARLQGATISVQQPQAGRLDFSLSFRNTRLFSDAPERLSPVSADGASFEGAPGVRAASEA